MPCRSDYLCVSGAEAESKRVCEFLVYLYDKIKEPIEPWIRSAAEEYYGDIKRLDKATAMLCLCCRSFSPEEVESYIYDAHSKIARELAGWWERHQDWDSRRVKEEAEIRKGKEGKNDS